MRRCSTWPRSGIRAAAGVDSVVVGYSMGGRLALHAALGQSWRGLVVVGASAGIADEDELRRRRAADLELGERPGVDGARTLCACPLPNGERATASVRRARR